MREWLIETMNAFLLEVEHVRRQVLSDGLANLHAFRFSQFTLEVRKICLRLEVDFKMPILSIEQVIFLLRRADIYSKVDYAADASATLRSCTLRKLDWVLEQ